MGRGSSVRERPGFVLCVRRAFGAKIFEYAGPEKLYQSGRAIDGAREPFAHQCNRALAAAAAANSAMGARGRNKLERSNANAHQRTRNEPSERKQKS